MTFEGFARAGLDQFPAVPAKSEESPLPKKVRLSRRSTHPAGRLLQGASHDARSIQQIPEWTAVRAGYCVDCLSQLMASRHGASAPRLMRYRAPLVVLAAR